MTTGVGKFLLRDSFRKGVVSSPLNPNVRRFS
jgi:hypothetical protein